METFLYAGELLLRILPILVAALLLVEIARKQLGEEKLVRLLAGRSTWGARMRAAALGALLPFCECGAFPIGTALIKAGVPVSAVLTFFLISPVLSIPAIFLLGGLLGLPFALGYLLITFWGGITAAFLIEKAGGGQAALKIRTDAAEQAVEVENGEKKKPEEAASPASCCTSGGCSGEDGEVKIDKGDNQEKGSAVIEFFKEPLQRALFTLKPLLPYIGGAVLAAGLLVSLVPPAIMEDFFARGGAWGVPLAALLGIPVYQGDCAMISVVAPLIRATGAGAPGAAFIIAGTGTSINGLILLNALFHRKFIAAYVLSVLTIAVVTGLVLQQIA